MADANGHKEVCPVSSDIAATLVGTWLQVTLIAFPPLAHHGMR